MSEAGEAGAGAGSFTRAEWLAWLAALLVAWTTLVAIDYRSRDPDSMLHIGIGRDMAARPLSRWIAPEWAGQWGSEGLYREHPVGTFVPIALLARVGFPAGQTGFALNAVYQVLTLLLVCSLAGLVLARYEARALACLIQLLPIAFTYRVRANHEQLVLLFLLLALYGTERSRRSPGWMAATVAGIVGAMLVKGVVVLLVVGSCVSWLLATRAAASWRQAREPRLFLPDRRAWLGVLLAVATAVAVGIAYESAYRHVTGQSFVAEYLRRQIVLSAAQQQPDVLRMVGQKLANVWWYLIRTAWFSVPWSLVLLVAAGRIPWARRAPRPAAVAYGNGGGEHRLQPPDALVGLLVIAAMWVLAFSLFDRRADRFIFPAYYLVGGAGAAFAMRASTRVHEWIWRLARLAPHEIVAIWLTAFFLQFVSIRAGLPFVNW